MFTKKMMLFGATPLAIALLLSPGALLAGSGQGGLSPIEKLGKKIFFDETLSLRLNQACASCHAPEAGWTGPDSPTNEHGAVYEGSVKHQFGNRKPPSSAYASLAPIFYADFGNRLLGNDESDLATDPLFVGGNFWDGRATGWELGNPAADQAQGPFLNPVEQALPDAACVVYRVCEGKYGHLFDEVWNPKLCMISWPNNIEGQCRNPNGVIKLSKKDRKKVDNAYDRIALSIAAFEGSKASNAFSAKIDAHRAGFYEFTEVERLGHDLFRGKGKCVLCHVGARGHGDVPPLLTDNTYDNLGVPKNPENPFQQDNPDWVDPGLAGFLDNVAGFSQYADANYGKSKVPTLRNVALGSCEAEPENNDCIVKAYMHNGYFKSLKQVVHFYNTRDIKPVCDGDYDADQAMEEGCWPAPEVAENVNTDELGDLGLTEEEEDALVAFMQAMSDGFIKHGGNGGGH